MLDLVLFLHIAKGVKSGRKKWPGHFWDNSTISHDPWSLGPTYSAAKASAQAFLGVTKFRGLLQLKDPTSVCLRKIKGWSTG